MKKKWKIVEKILNWKFENLKIENFFKNNKFWIFWKIFYSSI